jgi:hypothetical protein
LCRKGATHPTSVDRNRVTIEYPTLYRSVHALNWKKARGRYGQSHPEPFFISTSNSNNAAP